jgi:hypothetical protein
MSGVSFSEAVSILRGMLCDPARVRAVRAFEDARYGPVPFFFGPEGVEAVVTLTFEGEGVLGRLDSVRIGSRFSNHHDWDESDDGNPLDELSATEVEMIEISLRGATAR